MISWNIIHSSWSSQPNNCKKAETQHLMNFIYRYRYLIKLFRVLVLFASISLRLQSRQLRRLIEQNMLNPKKEDSELYLHSRGPHRGWWVNVYLSTMSIHGAKAISSAASRRKKTSTVISEWFRILCFHIMYCLSRRWRDMLPNSRNSECFV